MLRRAFGRSRNLVRDVLNSDKINFLFESAGAFFAFASLVTLVRDSSVQGIFWPQIAFSAMWSGWCLLYYSDVGHMWSLTAASVRTGITLAWVGTYLFWI